MFISKRSARSVSDHLHGARLGVAHDVRQRFLKDAKEGGLLLGAERRARPVGADVAAQPGACLECHRFPVNRFCQTQMIQCRRTQRRRDSLDRREADIAQPNQ